MDFRDVVRMGLEELEQDMLRALEGLREEEMYYQPTPESNHIAFLVWHLSRAEDNWFQRFARGGEPLWVAEGWHRRMGLPPEDSGYRYTAEQVRNFPHLGLSLLLDYHGAVRRATLDYLPTLTPAGLERTPWPRERPGVTVGWMLSHILCEIGQHVGHIRYIRGMLRGLDR